MLAAWRSRRHVEPGRDHRVCATGTPQPLLRIPASGGEPVAVTRLVDQTKQPPVSSIPARWPPFPVLRPRDAGHGRAVPGLTGRVGGDAPGGGRRGWRLCAERLGPVHPWGYAARTATGSGARSPHGRSGDGGRPGGIRRRIVLLARFPFRLRGLVAYRSGRGQPASAGLVRPVGKDAGDDGRAGHERALCAAPFTRWPPCGSLPHGRRATPTSGFWTRHARRVSPSIRASTDIPSGRRTAATSCSTRSAPGAAISIWQRQVVRAARSCCWSRRRTSLPVDWSRDGRFLLYHQPRSANVL